MKGFRTLLSNGIVMILSGIEFATGEMIAVEDQTAVIAGALALMNIVYRFITTTPVGEKS